MYQDSKLQAYFQRTHVKRSILYLKEEEKLNLLTITDIIETFSTIKLKKLEYTSFFNFFLRSVIC
ncbi:hypothetical protein DRK59_20075 [Salmonella enterica subsp. diarizonae]|nr:hypothetical protein DOE63_08770 [Salmonella enterica subsp. diarizonae serovar 59:z10:-]EAQ6106304.1 hypothetical protein [Salmonella enterica]ECE0110452.1 hypothetical protein [Salmonella enterica subsp. diarizonae]EAQ6117363.1 hypothetical protein [Salmonella enterica]EAT4593753.1 hypothetical protein [Salmonella enterica]